MKDFLFSMTVVSAVREKTWILEIVDDLTKNGCLKIGLLNHREKIGIK